MKCPAVFQPSTQMNDIFASIDRLTKQLNEFQLVKKQDLVELKGQVAIGVNEKLSQIEQRVSNFLQK